MERGARPHWHTYIELLYVVEGRYSITIGKDDYAALPGDFFIINSEETHGTTCTSAKVDHSLLVIQFEPSVIFSSLGSLFEFAYMVPFLKNEVRYEKYVKLRRDSGLKQILTSVLQEFSSRRPGFELEIKRKHIPSVCMAYPKRLRVCFFQVRTHCGSSHQVQELV